MKLLYDFEYMQVGDDLVGVPVGDNANKLHAMLNLNDEAKQLLEIIKDCDTPEEALDKVVKLYPEDDRNELGQQLCDFLNQLIREGLLIP